MFQRLIVFNQRANANAMFYFNGNLHARFLSYNYLSVIFACYFSEQVNYAVLSLLLPDQYEGKDLVMV